MNGVLTTVVATVDATKTANAVKKDLEKKFVFQKIVTKQDI
jgi:hypothetical protein